MNRILKILEGVVRGGRILEVHMSSKWHLNSGNYSNLHTSPNRSSNRKTKNFHASPKVTFELDSERKENLPRQLFDYPIDEVYHRNPRRKKIRKKHEKN